MQQGAPLDNTLQQDVHQPTVVQRTPASTSTSLNATQQELDQLMVPQKIPARTSTSPNATQQELDQPMVPQRTSATGSTSTSQNSMQQNEDCMMANVCKAQGPTSRAQECIQNMSSDF